MIIERKYATYGQLYCDQASKDTLIRILNKHNTPEFVCNYILNLNNDIIFCNTDMSSGIPGEAFHDLQQAFEDLDKTNPFDNGLTYRDVTEVVTLPSRKGSAVMQLMYMNKADLPKVIVQIVALEYKNGKTYVIEPWDTANLIL